VGPIWASLWGPDGSPSWARYQFRHGLHVCPKWAVHVAAYMGLKLAPFGQPIWASCMGPKWGAQLGSIPIWLRAPCPPQMGLKWAPFGQLIWASCMGPKWGAQLGTIPIWTQAPCLPHISLHWIKVGPIWAAYMGFLCGPTWTAQMASKPKFNPHFGHWAVFWCASVV
jgi:hypothetical protein